MENRIVEKGIKVDFHIHSIGSKFKDDSRVQSLTKGNINILIDKLNENEVNMCAITDHDNFEYDIYKALKKEEGKGSIQKVLPGVEFSVLFEEKVIHIIVIFDDSDESKLEKIKDILLHNDKPCYDDTTKEAYSEQKFLQMIKEIGLSNIMIAHQKGSLSTQKKPRKNDVLSLGEEKFGELIFVDYFDSFEFKTRKNEIFNKHYIEANKEKFKKNDIRFITGSDCHDWNAYPEEENFKYTYLKCLPTFKGVSMAVTNYTRIKYVNSFFTASKNILENIELKIDNVNKKIELSKGINVIIGDNSIGKSLLIHKLTGYKFLTTNKTSMKKSYDDYLKKNNIEIKTKILDKMLYEFDKQGGIREKFEQRKLNGTEFLNKYFPISPNVIGEKQKVLQEIDKLIDYLKNKKEIKNYEKNINKFEIYIRNENSNSLTFKNIDLNFNEKLSDYKALLENYTFIIEKINEILEKKEILDAADVRSILKYKNKFEELSEKYNTVKTNVEKEIVKVNAINDVMRIVENKLENTKTDEDKKFGIFVAAKSKLIENISQLLKLKSSMIKYVPKVDEKILEISSNIIGEYNFITKTNISQISNEYILEKIRQPFKKKFQNISIEQIDIDELEEKLLELSEEDTLNIIEGYRNKIIQNIEEEFKFKNAIISKEEKDLTKEMSAGFNSKIYFQILAYQDKAEGIYIIDQPEDDISPTAIKNFLLDDFKEMSKHRQVIIITHNPQFIVNLDVDNVIFISKSDGKINIDYGSLEYEDSTVNILDIISKNIDGGIDTINERWKRYEKNI